MAQNAGVTKFGFRGMVRVFAFIIAASALSTTSAHAGTYEKCQAASGMVDSVLHDCDIAELKTQDATLNQIYKTLLHAIDAGRQQKLRAAQQAWVTFVEAECLFRWSGEVGGTDAQLIHSGCKLELTKRRIKELNGELKIVRFLEGVTHR